ENFFSVVSKFFRSLMGCHPNFSKENKMTATTSIPGFLRLRQILGDPRAGPASSTNHPCLKIGLVGWRSLWPLSSPRQNLPEDNGVAHVRHRRTYRGHLAGAIWG